MKFFISVLIFIRFYTIETGNGDYSEKVKETWDPELLYEYTKKYYLSNNKDKNENLKHMIVDPENYLINKDILELNKRMKLLHDKLNINNYIFIISNLTIIPYRNKTKIIDPDKEMDRFLSKFNYIMYRENNYYDDSMNLMCIIFIDEGKIKFRTGIKLRGILKDKDILNIIYKLEIDLLEGNYYNVIYEFLKDINVIYIENYSYYNSFYYKNKEKIFFTAIAILLITLFILFYINYIPECEHEKKINDFLYQNKNIQYKLLFKYCCAICLSYFMPEKEKLKIENFLDKNKLKKEKTKLLKCGHVFHKYCIDDWETLYKNCPLCKLNEIYYNKNDCLIKDIVQEFCEIQREAFPHKINKAQCNRIVNNFKKENDSIY